MSRQTFLTLVAPIPLIIGLCAVFWPEFLLVEVKHAVPNPAALVMARTVGVVLCVMGVLVFAVRSHADSPTLRAVLLANLLLQLALIPVDPLAYAEGTFNTLGSFLPNTLLHLILAGGFAFHLWKSVARARGSAVAS